MDAGADAGDGGGTDGATDAEADAAVDGPLLLSELVDRDGRRLAGPWLRLADGSPVPPLPSDAPKQVRFGVVLVTFAGAQPSPLGLANSTRTKQAAKELADRLAGDAATDFHGAVQRGDVGSSDDVGRIQRGVLEAGPEYVLFTLPSGKVAGPLETPRGYWIVKRID